MKVIFGQGIDAHIADKQLRKRDVRFENVGKYRKRYQPGK